jgi:hypothetical protein
LVLTGSPVEDFIPAMLQQKQQVDIWSEGWKVGSVDFLRKYKIDECSGKLALIAAAVHALSEVELDRGGIHLAVQEDRLIRIFAKRFCGAHCTVSRLSGGVSGAKVVRLRITDSGGGRIHDAVAKLGSLDDIRDEATRFDNHVSRLDPGATPRKLATLEFGAGAVAGVFYGLAAAYDASAFDIALHQDGRAARAVRSIEAVTFPWRAGVPQTRRTIAAVRRRLLSDEEMARSILSYGITWATDFEANRIQTHWTCTHGDLHGSNVLLSTEQSAVVIDYGDVAEGPATLDPITLELSLIFHPQRPLLNPWPSIEQAVQWGVLNVYLEGCPVAEFVRECRAWASRVGAGQREIAASAYSYLVRQLKYQDTNKMVALALLDGVRRYYNQT